MSATMIYQLTPHGVHYGHTCGDGYLYQLILTIQGFPSYVVTHAQLAQLWGDPQYVFQNLEALLAKAIRCGYIRAYTVTNEGSQFAQEHPTIAMGKFLGKRRAFMRRGWLAADSSIFFDRNQGWYIEGPIV